MKKTKMGSKPLETLDLSEAKEEARRENWSHTVRQHAKEDEENSEMYLVSGPSRHIPSGRGMLADKWDMLRPAGSDDKQSDEIDDPFLTIESIEKEHGDLDELSDQDYDAKGEAVEGEQSGKVKTAVKELLQGQRRDIQHLEGRKVQVNLTFLKDKSSRERVKSIIGEVIKTYAMIPGHVDVFSDREGYNPYTFNVSNPYVSPNSDSSENISIHNSTMMRRQSFKKSLPSSQFSILKEGIKLQPRFDGLSEVIIQYGILGLNETGIINAAKTSPKAGIWELVRHALIQSGHYKRIATLYHFPKDDQKM